MDGGTAGGSADFSPVLGIVRCGYSFQIGFAREPVIGKAALIKRGVLTFTRGRELVGSSGKFDGMDNPGCAAKTF